MKNSCWGRRGGTRRKARGNTSRTRGRRRKTFRWKMISRGITRVYIHKTNNHKQGIITS